VEAALKPSFRKDLAMKSFPQAILNEAWAVNGQNGAACDDFIVDKLLDLSNEDGFVKEEPVEEEEEEDEEKEEDKDLGFWKFSTPYWSFWENLLRWRWRLSAMARMRKRSCGPLGRKYPYHFIINDIYIN
jgi:hypothetical protein